MLKAAHHSDTINKIKRKIREKEGLTKGEMEIAARAGLIKESRGRF